MKYGCESTIPVLLKNENVKIISLLRFQNYSQISSGNKKCDEINFFLISVLKTALQL